MPLTVANGDAVLKFADMAASIVTVTATTVIGRSDGLLITGNVSGGCVIVTDPPAAAAAADDTDIVQLIPDGEDVVAAAGEPTCPVCLENKRQLAPVECGHLALCFKCARAVIDAKDTPEVVCPICRRPAKRRMIRVFA